MQATVESPASSQGLFFSETIEPTFSKERAYYCPHMEPTLDSLKEFPNTFDFLPFAFSPGEAAVVFAAPETPTHTLVPVVVPITPPLIQL